VTDIVVAARRSSNYQAGAARRDVVAAPAREASHPSQHLEKIASLWLLAAAEVYTTPLASRT